MVEPLKQVYLSEGSTSSMSSTTCADESEPRKSFAQSVSSRRHHEQSGPPINPTFNDYTREEQPEDVGAHLWWGKIRHYNREAFSEFFGTFVLLLFGDGSVAQVVLSRGEKGDWQSINWGWALGVMLGVYCSGISGGHLNPAITFTNCVFRKFPWRKFPVYALSQMLGAACASAIVYANYSLAIDEFEGGPGIRTVPGQSDNATAGIFCSYPATFMTTGAMFSSEFLASSLLMFVIYAIKDDKNLGAGPLAPLALFFLVFGIGASFGWETAYALSVARDFGPRLMSYFVGYGSEVFTAGNHYFWIPPAASFTGCVFGGWLYDMFLFTGESPINTEWLGLRSVIQSHELKQSHAAQYP